MTTIALSSADPTSITADAIIIAVAAGDDGVRLLPGAEPVDAPFRGSLATTLGHLGATGKAGEVTKVPAAGAAKAAVVVAVRGHRREGTTSGDAPPRRRRRGRPGRHSLSRRGSPGGRRRRRRRRGRGPPARVVHVLRLQDGQRQAHPGTATIVTHKSRDKAVKAAVVRAEIVGEAVNRTRSWVNTPARDLTPAAFADAAVAHAKGLKLNIDVLDEKALARRGYGGILGVGQGSANPPRLVRIAYRPSRAKRHVAFVGKGITFDSRLSLKPNDSMVAMKSDMSGAAAGGGRRRRGPAGAARRRHRLRAHGREHAVGQRSASLRRADDVRREDRRGAQHRRRGSADTRRCDRPRRRGRSRPDRRHRHTTGACVVALGTRVWASWPPATTCWRRSTTPRTAPVNRCGRCHCPRNCARSSTPRRRHRQPRGAVGWGAVGRCLPQGVRPGRHRVGAPGHRGPAFNDKPFGYTEGRHGCRCANADPDRRRRRRRRL